MTGVQETAQLRAAGFSSEEIAVHQATQRRQLSAGGFSEEEINAYFGDKDLDMTRVQQHFDDVRRDLLAPEPTEGEPRQAASIKDYLEVGWGMSVTGLSVSGKMPDVAMGEDAPWYGRVASTAATLTGDFPAMVMGSVLGAAAGGAVGTAVTPGPGSLVGLRVGAGGGAFALPAMLREELIQNIREGRVKDSRDFLDRVLAISWEGLKGFVTGATTAGIGTGVKLAQPLAKPALNTALQLGAEVTTLTEMGAALEGRLPQPHEFIDAAILLGGMKAATGVRNVPGALARRRVTKAFEKYTAAKLEDIYAKTGKLPAEVLADAEKDPTIKQDIFATDKDIPDAYRDLVEAEAKPTGVPALAKESAKEAVKGEKPPRRLVSDDEAAVLARIGATEALKGADIPELAHALYSDLKNDLHPLVRLTKVLSEGEDLSALNDPGKLAHLTRGNFSKADHFLEFSPFKFGSLRNVGKPLKAIVEPVKDELDQFRAYAVARRSVELKERGIKTGVPDEEALGVLAKAPKKYIRAFNELQDYQRSLVEYLRDSGIVGQEMYEAMLEANKDYIPFYRLMGDVESGPRAGRGLRVNQPVRKIKGSERQIVDPIESVIKNTYTFIDLAERNRVGQALVRLAEEHPDGAAFLVKTRRAVKPTRVEMEEVERFFKKNDIPVPKGLDAEDLGALTVFRPGGFVRNDEITVFFDGKRQVYRADPELAKAFNALDRHSIGLLTKALAIPAKALRAGAVLTPDFMARNLFRDQLHAFILSEGGYVPFVDAIRGMWSLVGRDEAYQQWLKSGGPNAALVDIDRRYVATHVFKLVEDTSFLKTARNVVKAPIDILRIGSELAENATRLGEFKKVAGKTPNIEQILEAGFSSREVTLDFARIGAKTRGMNLITAFWNARLEGLDRVARGAIDHPARVTAKAFASITLPSVLLWWANHDDPRWKEIPQWQKDFFWIVMTDDHIYRVPKPFEVGLVFGTVPERVLDWVAANDPHALDGLTRTIVAQFGLDVIPTAAVPPLEQWANRSKFTGGSLIPAWAEGALPEDQYRPYTTQLTRAMGRLIGEIDLFHYMSGGPASPVIIDNYIRGWTGGLGNYALHLADWGLRKAGKLPDPVTPADTLADIPFVRAFIVRHPSSGAQPIQQFYDRYRKNAAVLQSLRIRAQDGDVESVQKEYALAPDAALKLDGIRDGMSNAAKFVRMIYKSPTMSTDEKRQLIDLTYYQMTQMATLGNNLMDEAEKVLSP